MTQKLISKLISIRVLLILILSNYIIFLLLDLYSHDIGNAISILLKYTNIILCFILSIMIGPDYNTPWDKLLLQIGLFFTLIADLFLLILNLYSWGISIFILVQVLYIFRFQKDSHKLYIQLFILMGIYSLITVYILIKTPDVTHHPAYFPSFLYGFVLLFSVWSAIYSYAKNIYSKPTYFMVVIGMLLFFLCDLHVAKSNIGPAPSFMSSYLIWFFYIPSQLFLSLSGYKLKSLREIFMI